MQQTFQNSMPMGPAQWAEQFSDLSVYGGNLGRGRRNAGLDGLPSFIKTHTVPNVLYGASRGGAPTPYSQLAQRSLTAQGQLTLDSYMMLQGSGRDPSSGSAKRTYVDYSAKLFDVISSLKELAPSETPPLWIEPKDSTADVIGEEWILYLETFIDFCAYNGYTSTTAAMKLRNSVLRGPMAKECLSFMHMDAKSNFNDLANALTWYLGDPEDRSNAKMKIKYFAYNGTDSYIQVVQRLRKYYSKLFPNTPADELEDDIKDRFLEIIGHTEEAQHYKHEANMKPLSYIVQACEKSRAKREQQSRVLTLQTGTKTAVTTKVATPVTTKPTTAVALTSLTDVAVSSAHGHDWSAGYKHNTGDLVGHEMNVMEDLAAMNHYAKRVQNYYSGNQGSVGGSQYPNRDRRNYNQDGDRRRRSPSPVRSSNRNYDGDQGSYSQGRNNSSNRGRSPPRNNDNGRNSRSDSWNRGRNGSPNRGRDEAGQNRRNFSPDRRRHNFGRSPSGDRNSDRARAKSPGRDNGGQNRNVRFGRNETQYYDQNEAPRRSLNANDRRSTLSKEAIVGRTVMALMKFGVDVGQLSSIDSEGASQFSDADASESEADQDHSELDEDLTELENDDDYNSEDPNSSSVN